MLNQSVVTTDLLCTWPQKSYFVQISSCPSVYRGATQTRHCKIEQLKHPAQKSCSPDSARIFQSCATGASSTESPPKLLHFRCSNEAIPPFWKGTPQTIPSSALQAAPVASGISSGDISDLFWWPLVPSAPEWWGLANQERLAEVSGRSSWKRRCLEIPGGCWIQSVPPEVCRTLKLYQNHPQVHPSQSFPQPHPACLSFIDKKTRKKKKRFP